MYHVQFYVLLSVDESKSLVNDQVSNVVKQTIGINPYKSLDS